MTASIKYHIETCYDRYLLKGRALDWENQPDLYKSYSAKGLINLSKTNFSSKYNLWELSETKSITDNKTDLNLLAKILDLSYSFTAKARHATGDFYYRGAASAGALYPNEIYLGTYDVHGLRSCLYHYGIKHRQLTPIREENCIHFVSQATPKAEGCELVATLFITGIFFRSSWKYRERAYRYVLLDAGHLIQNIFWAITSTGVSFSCHYDFHDKNISDLLGLDEKREVCLACVHLTKKSAVPTLNSKVNLFPSSKTIIKSSQAPPHEVVYDQIDDIHWTGAMNIDLFKPVTGNIPSIGIQPKTWQPIQKYKKTESEMDYPDALLFRRSKRNFINRSIPRKQLMRLLELLDLEFRQLPSDTDCYSASVSIGFLANNIEGVEPGFYLLDFNRHCFGLVKSGSFTAAMASVCLEQHWLKNASVHFLFISNFSAIDEIWGPRSYRYAMMTAGRIGQSIYVGSTALGMGCCGIGALYDYEAQSLLDLSEDAFLYYLVAVGPVKHKSDTG